MSRGKQNLNVLPHNAGCYIFKNTTGSIIYIGKAKDIKKRVGSYFSKRLDFKTSQLVGEIAAIDFIITNNEVEALLLEARLIKENQPKYNFELKGGVRYAYIQITNEQFPRLETVRSFKRADKIFGPFAVAANRKNLIRLANSLFRLRTGKQKPIKIGDYYRIQCSTPPWRRQVTQKEYQADIKKAELLLKGKMTQLVKELKLDMKQLADQKQFEVAKIRRDQIFALKQLKEEQHVQLTKAYNQDVINYLKLPNTFIVQLFNITKGVISNRQKFSFPLSKIDDQPEELLADFLSQYYYSNEVPQEVIIPNKLKGQNVFEHYLTKLAEQKVKIITPQRGDKIKLLKLIKKNIMADLKYGDRILFELQTALKLPRLPKVIECFDVSNLGSNQIVGSMVSFKDGVPDKNNYRRFKIKWQKQQSDFGAMKEIVLRRYYRLQKESAKLPDLVLIDGGKPQLSAAISALKKLKLNLTVVALAKQEEELFLPNQSSSIRLSKNSDALKLVQHIRDEAHRFAISYHRLLRKNQLEK